MISVWTSPAKAADDQGALNFTGKVALATCELEMPSSITMATIRPSDMGPAGQAWTGQTLTLRLHGEGCTDGVLPFVTADPAQWHDGFFRRGLINSGTALDIAVVLGTDDGLITTPYALGGLFPPISGGTSSTATYKIFYESRRGVPLNQPSLLGTVISSMTLNITYQ